MTKIYKIVETFNSFENRAKEVGNFTGKASLQGWPTSSVSAVGRAQCSRSL